MNFLFEWAGRALNWVCLGVGRLPWEFLLRGVKELHSWVKGETLEGMATRKLLSAGKS